MANLCTNKVRANGQTKDIKKFISFAKKEKNEFISFDLDDLGDGYSECNQTKDIKKFISFAKKEKNGFIRLDLDDLGDGYLECNISYSTNWLPDKDWIRECSTKFKEIEFKHCYEEGGCQICGGDEYVAGETYKMDNCEIAKMLYSCCPIKRADFLGLFDEIKAGLRDNNEKYSPYDPNNFMFTLIFDILDHNDFHNFFSNEANVTEFLAIYRALDEDDLVVRFNEAILNIQ